MDYINTKNVDEMYNVLEYALHEDSSLEKDHYCYIKNSDNKEWLLNDKNKSTIKLGLNIYEPQSKNGKLLKIFLPIVFELVEKYSLLGIKRKYYEITEKFSTLIADYFNIESSEIHCNFFLGTPSIHQKIVVQVDDGKSVLGYIKLSNNEQVKESFKREYSQLNWLHSKGIDRVPQALYCDNTNETGIFIQSSQKTKGSYNSSKLDKSVFSFIENFNNKTKETVNIEDTDFYKLISISKGELTLYPGNKNKLIDIINFVKRKNKGQLVNWCAYHGDFTPWNTFRNENGDLYAFDFEYSLKSCPPYMDLYHWFVSDSIYRLHLDSKQIIKAFDKSIIKKYIKNPEKIFVYYLLTNICFYLKREKNNLSGINLVNMKLWDELLIYYYDGEKIK